MHPKTPGFSKSADSRFHHDDADIVLIFETPGGFLDSYAGYHSGIHLVFAVQYSKIDLGFRDFQSNCIMYFSFLNRKNVSAGVFLVTEFDRDAQNWAHILGMALYGSWS